MVSSLMSRSLSVIVPVRDEAESLPAFWREWQEAKAGLPPDTELLFIENGSSDESRKLLLSFEGAGILTLATHPAGKTMKAAAIQAGIDHATGTILATIDADLQEHPSSLSSLLEALGEGTDFVVGKRRRPARAISSIGNALRRMLGFRAVTDVGCGLRAWKKECTGDIVLYGEWDRYLPDLVALRGFAVREVDVPSGPRRAGISKFRATKSLRATADLLGLWLHVRWGDRPMQFFGSAAILLCICALLVGGAFLLPLHSSPATHWILSVVIGGLLACAAFCAGMGVSADRVLGCRKPKALVYVLREPSR